MRWAFLAGGCVAGLTTGFVHYNPSSPSSPSTIAWASDRSSSLSHSFHKFPVTSITELSHDTKLLSFALPHPDEPFRLTCSQTLQCGVMDPNRSRRITRHYTPVTPNGTPGHFSVMVKRCPEGLLSPRLHALQPGDTMEWATVPPSFVYKPGMFARVYMIAGGAGITPMLQMIRTVLGNPSDTTPMRLLFCNKTEQDILLRGELDKLAKEHPGRFQVHYALDQPPAGWSGESGYVTAEMVRRTLKEGGPEKGDRMLVCGPDAMLNHVAGNPMDVMGKWSGKVQRMQPFFPGVNNLPEVEGVLGSMGWDKSTTHRF